MRQPTQMVFVLEGRVDAWLQAGGRVVAPRPASCPVCGHGWVTFDFDGFYPRHTRWGRVRIRRVWCTNESCKQRSHSLLPDVLVSGRVDLVSVIGWALESQAAGVGHRSIAAALGVPEAAEPAHPGLFTISKMIARSMPTTMRSAPTTLASCTRSVRPRSSGPSEAS